MNSAFTRTACWQSPPTGESTVCRINFVCAFTFGDDVAETVRDPTLRELDTVPQKFSLTK